MVDLTIYNGIGHPQLPAVGLHRGKVHAGAAVGVAHIQGDGLHRKGHGVKFPQLGQGGEQHQGVLAPRHPNRHPVSGGYHLVILHTAAHQGEYLVHGLAPFSKVRGKPGKSRGFRNNPGHFFLSKTEIESE